MATVTLVTSQKLFGSQNLLGESPKCKSIRTLKHQIISSLKGLVTSSFMDSILGMNKTYYININININLVSEISISTSGRCRCNQYHNVMPSYHKMYQVTNLNKQLWHSIGITIRYIHQHSYAIIQS